MTPIIKLISDRIYVNQNNGKEEAVAALREVREAAVALQERERQRRNSLLTDHHSTCPCYECEGHVMCPRCDGSGEGCASGLPCGHCRGAGVVTNDNELVTLADHLAEVFEMHPGDEVAAMRAVIADLLAYLEAK